jgi:hypothetical protein
MNDSAQRSHILFQQGLPLDFITRGKSPAPHLPGHPRHDRLNEL